MGKNYNFARFLLCSCKNCKKKELFYLLTCIIESKSIIFFLVTHDFVLIILYRINCTRPFHPMSRSVSYNYQSLLKCDTPFALLRPLESCIYALYFQFFFIFCFLFFIINFIIIIFKQFAIVGIISQI